MKLRSLFSAASIGLTLLLPVGSEAGAAELRVLSALATRTVMADIGPMFERATGHKLEIKYATLGAGIKRVSGGETFDVVIMPGMPGFLKKSAAAADNVTPIARSGIGVAVRKGAAKPDISSPEALRGALLAAKSITYANPAGGGAAGVHFAKVLERLGIADEMQSKTVFHPKADATGILVANGEAEIGVNQIQVLMPVAGIEIVGPLPGDLQNNIVFSAAVMSGNSNAEASKALADFLRTPEAAAVIKAKGLEPASNTGERL